MKRRLALLVCIITTLAMVFTLASCGGDECEHTYSTEYTTDANGHWYVATCGCEGEVSNYGAHVDSNNDGKCDTCKYVLCAHTYETEWSTDENNHWNASNCDCTPTKANEAKHVDENKDGICDVCKYVMCEHTYSDWKTDETKHWKEATCGCTVANTEEGAHVDENKDGNCDTCAYVMCEHTYATEWSTDGAYHWYAATCGCNVVGSKAEHTNEDGDKLCDVCGANICEHTYEETLSSNETHHWYAATCGCDVKKEYAEHTWAIIAEDKQHYTGTTCGCNYTKDVAEHADEDGDDKCDTCESDMALFNVIAGLDQEANAGANNIVVDVDKAVYSDYGDEVIDAEAFVKYYKDYAVYKDVDGYTYYYSYYGENGTDLFAIIVDSEGNASRNNYAEYPVGGATMNISLVYGNAVTYNGNIEEIVSELYNLGAAKDQEYGYSYCFTKSYNEETGAHKFAYVYFEEDKAYEVKVEFTVAENAIATSTIEINTYYGEDVTVSGNTYTVAEGAAKTQEEKYVIAQTFGDPFDSTDAPNPYPAADYIVTEDYKLGVKDEDGDITEIEKNATVEIDAAKEVYFYFPESLKDVIGFNDITTTVYDSEDNESYSVSCYYDSDEKAIYVRSNYAGTYKVVVDLEGVEFTFNVKVNYLAPQTMSTFTINVDSGKGTSESEVTMYNGQSLLINSVVSAGCDPAFVAALTKGDAATLEINENGTYTFKPSATGEFEVTLTSSVASDVTAKVTITVVTPPTAAEILNGKYEAENMYSGLTVGATFTPAEEGATTGNVVVTVEGEAFSYDTWEWETINLSATYSYSYNSEDDTIVLTYVEGDELEIELYIKNYSVCALYDYSEYGLEKVVVVEPEEKEPTTDFTFTITYEATYDYSSTPFTFVAGEAGTYTFTVPATVGVITKDAYENYGSELVSFNDNDSGATFTLDLEAGEAIDLYVTSTVDATYTITFTTGEVANNVVTYTGTNADVTPSTITVIIDEANKTVTYKFVHSMTGMEASMVYDYTIEDGLMSLYFQGEAVSETDAYVTLVDGVATVAGLKGNTYTLVAEDDDDDEETSAITGDGSETNPFVVSGAGSTLISAGQWVPLFVQVKAGVTVTLPEGAKFYTDPTDTSTVVGATVTPTEDTLYYVYADSMAGCTGMMTATAGSSEGGNDQITGSGTEGDPYVLTTAGTYTCAFPGGMTPIWYTYNAEKDGTLTLSSTYASAWLGVAEDAMTANNTNNEGEGSRTISVTAGTTYYIMVGDYNEAAMDVPFTITVE